MNQLYAPVRNPGVVLTALFKPNSLYLTTFSRLKIDNPSAQTSRACILEHIPPVLVATKQGNIPRVREGAEYLLYQVKDFVLSNIRD